MMYYNIIRTLNSLNSLCVVIILLERTPSKYTCMKRCVRVAVEDSARCGGDDDDNDDDERPLSFCSCC